MVYLSTVDKVKDSDLLALGTTHLKMDTPFDSAEALRDHLIELISVRNLRHVCSVPPILAEAHAAQDVSFLGPRAATTHPSPCPLGGRYSDLMDLPPHTCFLT